MGTARPLHWGGHPKAPHSPSTHLGRAEDGFSEELDEGLVVVVGQDCVLQQPHCQPQGTQLSPAMTPGGSHGSCALHLVLLWSPPPVPSACTHPWSSVVLGKGRSWNQPLVGPGQRVSKKNST